MVDEKNNNATSLAGRLTLAITAVVVVVTLLAGGWFYADAVHKANAGIEAKARDLGVYLQGALRLPLWSMDDLAVEMIGRTLMEDRAVSAVTIQDPEGRILFTKQTDKGAIALTRLVSIEHEDEPMGTVQLSLSSKLVRAQTENLLRASIATLLAVLVAITLSTVFLVNRFLKRPIEQLTTVANSFGMGSHTAPKVMAKGYREFYPLLSVLTGMEQQINRQISELTESEERFRSIFESAAAPMGIISPEGIFLQVNPATCRLLGYSEEELLKLEVDDVTHPDDREKNRALYEAVLTGERTAVSYEKRYQPKDGSTVWGHTTIAPVRGSKGDVLYLVALTQDITERKRAEEALRESDRVKTEFVRTAAHEFRTPLTSIQGFSQVLLNTDDISPEAQREYLTYIYERSVALADVVANLLDISRIETGQGLSLTLAPCAVNDIFLQVTPFLKTQGSKHRVEVVLAEDSTLLNIDKGKIGAALENLLSNAVKFSAVGSLIRIRGERIRDGYRICVADQGIGMTSDQAAKVFDKFYRADASHTAAEGIGLGMSIVKQSIEAHGGKIWVESELSKGTTVCFTIPLCCMTDQ